MKELFVIESPLQGLHRGLWQDGETLYYVEWRPWACYTTFWVPRQTEHPRQLFGGGHDSFRQMTGKIFLRAGDWYQTRQVADDTPTPWWIIRRDLTTYLMKGSL